MLRLLTPALFLATPALAHTAPHFHAHDSDYAGLLVGLALITVAAIAICARRPK